MPFKFDEPIAPDAPAKDVFLWFAQQCRQTAALFKEISEGKYSGVSSFYQMEPAERASRLAHLISETETTAAQWEKRAALEAQQEKA